MRSIKVRLVGNFVFVIVITVVIFEIFLINSVKQYYYNNVEEVMTNQIKFSADFYNRYLSSSSLEDNIIDNVDVFWQQTNAEVQVIDLKGNILMDSIGVPLATVQSSDFKKAAQGLKGKWIGKINGSEDAMAVSYPLKSDDRTIGVLRFITSLKEVNKAIKKVSMVFIWAGLFVIFISGLVSIFLSDTIIKPLREVTNAAEKMADGKLSVKSIKKYDDEIGKLSDTLNYMAEEILKREKMKDEFISSISHELRTPLTSIKGWAITLNTDDLKDQPLIRDGLEIIEKESDRLTHMVEELLDFSKLSSRKITLNLEKVDIIHIMKHVEKQLSPRANAENIKFDVTYPKSLPSILGDENRLKQVFINLLDNAFKFISDDGKVEFSARQDKGNIIICIKDNGCGISEEDLPYVKEKFYKGKNSKSKTGLGLSICDEIIKLHNGSLEIKSEENKGTEVYVTLPVDREEQENEKD
ncbi:MAG: HAMP domain-containing sensor histidine kinase [Clostridiales bacterium]|nr:HAMP domain-containing sensor histidine kinase [Clostridiales bacterium]